MSRPEAASHSFMVPSQLPVSTRVPSGENAALVTDWPCPVIGTTSMAGLSWAPAVPVKTSRLQSAIVKMLSGRGRGRCINASCRMLRARRYRACPLIAAVEAKSQRPFAESQNSP